MERPPIEGAKVEGARVEGAIVDERSDEGAPCRDNRPPNRLRSDGAFSGVVSIGDGGSGEGSMPWSSYKRYNK